MSRTIQDPDQNNINLADNVWEACVGILKENISLQNTIIEQVKLFVN